MQSHGRSDDKSKRSPYRSIFHQSLWRASPHDFQSNCHVSSIWDCEMQFTSFRGCTSSSSLPCREAVDQFSQRRVKPALINFLQRGERRRSAVNGLTQRCLSGVNNMSNVEDRRCSIRNLQIIILHEIDIVMLLIGALPIPR